MKIIKILSILAGLFALSFQQHETQSLDSGQLVVSVTGLDNMTGQIGILLFDQQEGFPTSREYALREILLPIESKQVRYTFSDLPFGSYAVSVMHDENENKQLDTNLFGVPTEGNGVSNNIINRWGPPKFTQAAFQFDSPSFSIAIKIQY